MNKIKIIDNLVEQKTSKPIEFLYCLQTWYNEEKLPQWCYITNPALLVIKQITRVGVHQIGNDIFDVIIAESMDGRQIFWLGHWNDGVVNE